MHKQVAGNIVNGVNWAAQIIVQEFAMELSQGYIDELNFDGTIKIRNGPFIRINDPNAVFSAGFSAPFMVCDDKSPSISSFSGFPMCVPRSANDTLCPSSNRPVSASGTPLRVFQAPDALVMSPFVVGDFIEYRGYRTSANQMVVFEIVSWNVQITTVGAPTYIRVEATLIGVYSNDPDGEVAETRYIGYTSDPSATVSISAIDIDPCTGEESDRPIGVGQLRPEAGGRNKWLARIDGTLPLDYTREYRAVASTGTVLTRNGILAGQYVAPILEWIQPELLVPGNEPLIHQFSRMTHLTKGVGPDEDGNFWGPLEPFPQSGVTIFNVSTCPPPIGGPTTPVDPADPVTPVARVDATIPINQAATTTIAVANKPLYVRVQDTFKLRGYQDATLGTNESSSLMWTWSLLASRSAGTLSNLQTFTRSANNQTATLKFANAAPDGDYVFQLAISSPTQNLTGTATFTVKLFSGPDTIAVTAVTWTSAQSGTIGVVCSSNYLVDYRVGMSVTYPGDKGIATSPMAATPPGSGSWSFSARKVDQPGTITCTSLLGGSATRNGLTSKKKRDEDERSGMLEAVSPLV
ncbi:hypothetical protein B0H63DRAFT_497084 [Podospora didyma]|uniref:Uncharacterized protein n=1 Tax=Podospora didyma TaxID=330526 RepID=A0AAE0KAV7_9PEZI|nr:hypothetical protein B0H63DRAFT_497084 [Podospora didyma]